MNPRTDDGFGRRPCLRSRSGFWTCQHACEVGASLGIPEVPRHFPVSTDRSMRHVRNSEFKVQEKSLGRGVLPVLKGESSIIGGEMGWSSFPVGPVGRRQISSRTRQTCRTRRTCRTAPNFQSDWSDPSDLSDGARIKTHHHVPVAVFSCRSRVVGYSGAGF